MSQNNTAPKLHVLEGVQNVISRLTKVGVSKQGKNDSQGYSFRGIDQVLNVLSPILVESKLLIIPEVVECETKQYKTARGSTLFNTTITINYVIKSLVDDSFIVTKVVGMGSDSGDKSVSKAMSMAYKYFAFQTFCIPIDSQSVDDSDKSDPEEVEMEEDTNFNHGEMKATQADINRLIEICKKKNISKDALMKDFNIKDMKAIDKETVEEIINKLKEKK